ncbi:MAG: sensor histidine kinase [Ferrovibrio sp.]|uniref:sensor histidine kinase n=1 Tax=Ferrovibrio sp. TaxID=1917215 RepID=UPI0039198872
MPRRFLPQQIAAHPEALAGAGRRFVLVLVATVVGLSLVLAAYFYVQQREYNRFSFQNIVWEGAQFRNEHQAFRAALLEYLNGTSGATEDEVRRRYDILHSRLDMLQVGRASATYMADPDLSMLLTRIDPVVRNWDGQLDALFAGNRQAGDALAVSMRRLDADFSAFAAGVNAIGIRRVDDARERLSGLYDVMIVAGVATWLLVIGFAYALMRQLRASEAAHTEMRAMTVDLENARRQAEEASRTKSNFLATMSHELRTPLNAILGFADIMRQGIFGPVGNPRYEDYLDGIVKSGQHLLSLINDVLDMSRIEAGRLELVESRIDVGQAIDQALDMVTVTAQGKGVVLERALPASLPCLRADDRLLRQMLLNLLSNAIKFTPEGGQVEIAVALLGEGDLAIRVRDTGIGMSDRQLQKVFEPFSQGDSMRAREAGGSGLGLPITRRLIELHDGRIHLASRKRNGTTATLVFPAARVSPAGAAA